MKAKELKKKKEKLSFFEKNVSELWKSLDRYLSVSKEYYNAQAAFHDDLKRFYEEIPLNLHGEKGESSSKSKKKEQIIRGSTSQLGILFSEQCKEERFKSISLLESLKMSVSRVQKEYDSMFSVMKKRLHDSPDSSLSEDFKIFEEQRHERFDPIFLILMRLSEINRAPLSLQTSWAKGAANTSDISSSTNRILSSQPSIIDILNNTHGLNYFQTFVAKEYSVENVNFWIAANQYKHTTTAEGRKKKALEMYEKHFKENAKEPLNLDQIVVDRVISNLNAANPNLFDEAQKNILELMRADSFPRFLKDPLFKRLQNRLEKRDFTHSQPATTSSPSVVQKDPNRLGAKHRKLAVLEEISLRDSEWDNILSYSDSIQASKGEALTYFSDTSRCLYKVIQGKVKMEGTGSHIFKLNEGEVFGEANFLNLNGSQFRYTSTDTKTEVARIEEDRILPFLTTDFKLAEKFYKMICGQLAYHLYGVSLKSVIAQFHDRSKSIVSENEDSSEVLKARKFLSIPDSVPFHKDFDCTLVRSGKTQGTLFVFDTCVFFYARFFGLVTRIAVQLDGLKSVKRSEKSLVLNGGDTKLLLQFAENTLSEAKELITKLWKKHTSSASSDSQPTLRRKNSIWRVPSNEIINVSPGGSFKEETPVWEPIESDLWTPIFEVATTTTFSKGEVVLQKADTAPKIYQILNGVCSVEFAGEKSNAIRMTRGDVFGEINYWYGGGATATIVADQDGVVVYSVDRPVLEELFEKKPELSVKFFSFLAHQIGCRLLDREGNKYSHKSLTASVSYAVYPKFNEKEVKESSVAPSSPAVSQTTSWVNSTQTPTEKMLYPDKLLPPEKLLQRKSSKLRWGKEFQNSFPRRLTPPLPETMNSEEKVPPLLLPKPSNSDTDVPLAPRGEFRRFSEVGNESEQTKFGTLKTVSYDSASDFGSSRNRSNSS